LSSAIISARYFYSLFANTDQAIGYGTPVLPLESRDGNLMIGTGNVIIKEEDP